MLLIHLPVSNLTRHLGLANFMWSVNVGQEAVEAAELQFEAMNHRHQLSGMTPQGCIY